MGHVVVQNWVCSCTEFHGELLKADIRVECSILHFGLEADINAPEYPSSKEKAQPFSRPGFQNFKPKVAYAAVALEISFLIFNAAGDSSTSLDFAKNASRPPR